MAAFALSELLPNKWRHIGVVLADAAVLLAAILAPVSGRYDKLGRAEIVIKYFDKGSEIRFHEFKRTSTKPRDLEEVQGQG